MKSQLEHDLSRQLKEYTNVKFGPQPLDIGRRVTAARRRRQVGQAAIACMTVAGLLGGGVLASQHLNRNTTTVAAPAAPGQSASAAGSSTKVRGTFPDNATDPYGPARWNRLSQNELQTFLEAQYKLEAKCLAAKGFKHHRVDSWQGFFDSYDVVNGKTVLLQPDADGQTADKQDAVPKSQRAPSDELGMALDPKYRLRDNCQGQAALRLFGDEQSAVTMTQIRSGFYKTASRSVPFRELAGRSAIDRRYAAVDDCMKQRGVYDAWKSDDAARVESARPTLYQCYDSPEAVRWYSESELAETKVVYVEAPEAITEADRIRKVVLKNAADVLAQG